MRGNEFELKAASDLAISNCADREVGNDEDLAASDGEEDHEYLSRRDRHGLSDQARKLSEQVQMRRRASSARVIAEVGCCDRAVRIVLNYFPHNARLI